MCDLWSNLNNSYCILIVNSGALTFWSWSIHWPKWGVRYFHSNHRHGPGVWWGAIYLCSHTECVQKECETLQTTLHFKGHSGVDGKELVHELKNFPDLPSKSMTLLELLTFIHEKELTEIYPNLRTALRIGLSLPVTVAEAERSLLNVLEVHCVTGASLWTCHHQHQSYSCTTDFVWWCRPANMYAFCRPSSTQQRIGPTPKELQAEPSSPLKSPRCLTKTKLFLDLSKQRAEKEKKTEQTEVTKPQRVYAFLTLDSLSCMLCSYSQSEPAERRTMCAHLAADIGAALTKIVVGLLQTQVCRGNDGGSRQRVPSHSTALDDGVVAKRADEAWREPGLMEARGKKPFANLSTVLIRFFKIGRSGWCNWWFCIKED